MNEKKMTMLIPQRKKRKRGKPCSQHHGEILRLRQYFVVTSVDLQMKIKMKVMTKKKKRKKKKRKWKTKWKWARKRDFAVAASRLRTLFQVHLAHHPSDEEFGLITKMCRQLEVLAMA